MSNATTPCGLCGTPTYMIATKRCIRCWELETRIHADPLLAREILDRLAKPVEPHALACIVCKEPGIERKNGAVICDICRDAFRGDV
jgi:hypothetical protein